jgi:hypothetical protein
MATANHLMVFLAVRWPAAVYVLASIMKGRRKASGALKYAVYGAGAGVMLYGISFGRPPQHHPPADDGPGAFQKIPRWGFEQLVLVFGAAAHFGRHRVQAFRRPLPFLVRTY